MSLNWDVTKCENVDEMQENESGITDAVVWLALAVGLQEITEENVDEWCTRAALVQAIHGPFLVRGIYVTDEMIRRRIGLGTNVSNEPWGKWSKRQFGKVDRLIDQQREESAAIMASLEKADA